jgi:hypothetical protein
MGIDNPVQAQSSGISWDNVQSFKRYPRSYVDFRGANNGILRKTKSMTSIAPCYILENFSVSDL